jgi:hypothetical protein
MIKQADKHIHQTNKASEATRRDNWPHMFIILHLLMKVYDKQADKHIHQTGIAFESTRRDNWPHMFLILYFLMKVYDKQTTNFFIEQA